jgi:hypothetical protein
MSANALHTPARLFAVGALLWALTSCSGSKPLPCAAPAGSNSSTCSCGSGTAACPVTPGPEFLYATAVTSTGGQILSFSVDRNTGALTSIGSVPGPSISLGLAAVNNQFLYASDTHNSQVDGFSINQTTGALTALTGSPFSTGTLSVPGALASPPGILGSSPGSNLLYVADSGTVDAFSISSAGVPTAISGSLFLPEAGFSIAVSLGPIPLRCRRRSPRGHIRLHN